MRTPPKLKVGKVIQVNSGEPVRMPYRKNGSSLEYSICCDCGLTHLNLFEPKKRYLKLTCWRDDKVTKRFRRKRGQRLVKQYKARLPAR